VSLEQAEAELAPIYQRTLEQTIALLPPEPARGFRQFIQNFRFRLRPAGGGTVSYLRGTLDRPLRILSAIVVLVLLIACANLTGLLLSRATERRREFGIRLALGAARASLVGQVLIESMVLASVGGATGFALAVWMGPSLLTLGVGDAALQAINLTPDIGVLAFTGVVSGVCGLVIGLASVLRAVRTPPQEAWRPAGGPLKSVWGGRVLIAAQVAIAVVLVTGAVLFARSLANIRNVDPGFDTENVIMLTVAPGLAGYSAPRRLAYLEQAVAVLESLPGVASATFVARPLATGLVSQTGVGVPSFQSTRMEDLITGQNRVGGRFVETLGLALLHGRDLSHADRTASTSVALINESFARHFYGTTDVVGRQFLLPSGDMCSIVGVVRDARDRSIAQPSERWMYLPFVPNDVGQSARILVRTNVAVSSMLAILPRSLTDVDAAVPVYEVRTVAAQLERTLGTRRLLSMLSQLFGGVALLLIALGLYGMLNGLVSRRKREIGIRMALGADRAGIGWLVAREAAVVIAAGLVIGLLAALGTSRFLRSQLFGIAPNDPWALAVATAILIVAGALGMWVPSRRAVRVDPMVTLRYE
jgi:predicted permease